MITRLPKISIIVPSFNQGQYIEQTILSIISQNYDNIDLIIIDGGSSDNTVNILQKYNSNISYWISEPDSGQADAINKGLSRASGEIFNWINSDDYLEPGSLQKIGTYFLDNPDKQVLCGFTRCFFDFDNSTSHVYRMGIKSSPTATILNVEMNQPGTFYRTSIVKYLGGLNKSLRYVFDNELWFRYLTKYGLGKIGLTDSLFTNFRLHKDSKTVKEGFDLFGLESQAILKWLANSYEVSNSINSILLMENSCKNYISPKWDGNYFDVKLLESYLASKYMINLLNHSKYSVARNGFMYRYKNSLMTFDRKNVSVFFKLFLFPGFLKSNS